MVETILCVSVFSLAIQIEKNVSIYVSVQGWVICMEPSSLVKENIHLVYLTISCPWAVMRFHRRWGLFASSPLRVQPFGCCEGPELCWASLGWGRVPFLHSSWYGATIQGCFCSCWAALTHAGPNTAFWGTLELSDGEDAERIPCDDGEEDPYDWKEKQLK